MRARRPRYLCCPGEDLFIFFTCEQLLNFLLSLPAEIHDDAVIYFHCGGQAGFSDSFIVAVDGSIFLHGYRSGEEAVAGGSFPAEIAGIGAVNYQVGYDQALREQGLALIFDDLKQLGLIW